MRMNTGSATKRGRQFLITSGCLLLLAASANAAAPLPEGSQWPAMWQRRALIVRFHDLPKRYSCDDLWYKFRDVLERLGASSRMDILPDRCERSLGAAARSPRVRLEYFVPRQLERKNARNADLTAVVRTVRIEPGEPSSIDASDCALLRQMRPALPGQIVGYRLQCRGPPAASPAFSITVRALVQEDSATVPTSMKSR
jgi:hypothetical protein